MTVKGILAIGALYRLGELKEYLEITEKYLQKAKSDFEAWVNGQASKISAEERNDFNEFYIDQYWRYSERFPRILRNSFLISAHSLLEHEMAQICKRLKMERQIPLSWSDLKGDVFERFKRYCKLANLPLLYNDSTWQEINNYYMVRNCIVHQNGLVKNLQKDRDFVNYVTQKGIISDDAIEQEIALTEQFCREVIKTMEAFLYNVFNAYELQR